MLLEDPKGTFRYEPDGDQGPCYFLRVPAHYERGRSFRRRGRGGRRQTYGLSVIAAYLKLHRRSGVARRCRAAGQDRDTSFAAYQAGLAELGRRLEDGESTTTSRLREGMDAPPPCRTSWRSWPTRSSPRTNFRRMLAKNTTYRQVCGDVAARMFLAGWTRVSVRFSRSQMGVPDALLGQIPTLHRIGIGDAIQSRLRPSRQATKLRIAVWWRAYRDDFQHHPDATPTTHRQGSNIGRRRRSASANSASTRHLVTRRELMVLELFDMFRGGGMSHGPLPFAGGWAEQPAALIAAFWA